MPKNPNRTLSTIHFPFIGKLFRAFPKAELFLVGGIVRDALLGRPSKDYDFVVRNVPLQKLQGFLARQGSVDLVGRNFGVLKFQPKKDRLPEAIDIALPRTEHSFRTGGYRDFKVQSNPKLPLIDDLQRRDFTINALAYDLRTKKIIDPYGGLADIKKKTIRTVGKPAERFAEDYSRMLRALRFQCQLGFSIEKQTAAAITKLIRRINDTDGGEFIVPRETVAKEIVKSFTADPVSAFDIYFQTGATKVLLPELLKMRGCQQPSNFHSEGDVWKHTRICLGNLSSKKFQSHFRHPTRTPELIWAVLWHDIGKPYTFVRADRIRFNNHDFVGADVAKEVTDRLKLSSAGLDTERVYWLIRHHMITTHTKKSPMKKTTLEKYFFRDPVRGSELLQLSFADVFGSIPKNGKPDFTEFNSLERQINRLKKMGAGKKLPPPPLNGNEIMKLAHLPPGPRIGDLINQLREAQLTGTTRTKQQAVAFLKRTLTR